MTFFVVSAVGGVHLPNKHRKRARNLRREGRMRFDALPIETRLGIITDHVMDHVASLGRDCVMQQTIFNPAIHGNLPVENDFAP